MIITLKGADFSTSNIGTLSSWRITKVLDAGCTYTGASNVDKNASYTATVVIAEGYELGTTGVTVIMSGITLENAVMISGNVITITIPQVTGNVIVKVPTTSISVEPDEPDEPDVPEEPTIVWLPLPLMKTSLGVTESGVGRCTVLSENGNRLSTASSEVAQAILIPNGKTLHMRGLASGTYTLRMDYVCIEENIPCPTAASGETIKGVIGTASSFNADNYFPLNVEGADSVDVTNNYGRDGYYYFAFASLNKTDKLPPVFDTYTIEYYVD